MALIRVADYIAKRIVQAGVDTVFLVTGGGAMHLDDAVGRCDGLRYVCNHHEQASEAVNLPPAAGAHGRKIGDRLDG